MDSGVMYMALFALFACAATCFAGGSHAIRELTSIPVRGAQHRTARASAIISWKFHTAGTVSNVHKLRYLRNISALFRIFSDE